MNSPAARDNGLPTMPAGRRTCRRPVFPNLKVSQLSHCRRGHFEKSKGQPKFSNDINDDDLEYFVQTLTVKIENMVCDTATVATL